MLSFSTLKIGEASGKLVSTPSSTQLLWCCCVLSCGIRRNSVRPWNQGLWKLRELFLLSVFRVV